MRNWRRDFRLRSRGSASDQHNLQPEGEGAVVKTDLGIAGQSSGAVGQGVERPLLGLSWVDARIGF